MYSNGLSNLLEITGTIRSRRPVDTVTNRAFYLIKLIEQYSITTRILSPNIHLLLIIVKYIAGTLKNELTDLGAELASEISTNRKV